MDFLPAQKRNLVFLCISGGLAVALGFLVFSPSQALDLIRLCGYWLMAGTAILFFVSLVRYYLPRWSARSGEPIDWLRWVLVIVATGLLVVHEPFGFKVLMDELVLSATSMGFHLHREVFTALQTHNFDGAYVTLGGIVDKRPYFFPFLVSVLHDLTGYRPENVFVLNVLLTFALLALVSDFAARLINRAAGRLAVLLLAGLPLLALNATGGGFEILNLVMIVLAMTAATSYLEDRDARSLNLLVLTGVLLAQTRYESVIYLGAVGVVILMVWKRGRRIQVTWPLIAAPLLLIPYPLLNSVINAFRGFWQLPKEVTSPFSSEFIAGNLSHAVAFFFTLSPLQSNSVFLSVCGVVGLLFVFVLAFRKLLHRERLPASIAVLMIFGLLVICTFSILMCYHWGELDQYVVSRLSLPLCLLFALSVPVAFADFKPSPKAWNVAMILALGYALGFGIPSAARAYSTETFHAYRHTEWVRQFVRKHSDDGAYFIVPSPLVAVVYRQPAITNSLAATRADELEYHLDRETYTDAYVVQLFDEDLKTGDLVPRTDSVIGEEFILETVAERKFVPLFRSRISRIVEIRPEPPESQKEDPLQLIRRELMQKGKGDDVDDRTAEFFEMLP